MQVSRRLFNGFLVALPLLPKYDYFGTVVGEEIRIDRDLRLAPHTTLRDCKLRFVGGRLVVPDPVDGKPTVTIEDSLFDGTHRPRPHKGFLNCVVSESEARQPEAFISLEDL